jgi:hypothetical protein
LKKLVLIGLTVTAVFAIAAVAVAQYAVPIVTVKATDTPSKGGTSKKPVNGSTNITFNVNPESNSTLATVDYGIPTNFRISGAGFKPCTAQTINTKGEAACGNAPKVGTGAATALLGPGKTPIQFTVNVYAAGAKGLTLALKQTNGAVQVAFDATIANNHVAFKIPSNVQQPVAGLYSYVTSVTANLGPKSVTKTTTKKKTVKRHGKKKRITIKTKKKYSLVSRIGCAGGKDTFDVKLGLANNPNPPAQPSPSGTTTVPCQK